MTNDIPAVEFHKTNLKAINQLLSPLSNAYNIKYLIFVELLAGKNKASFLSNQPEVIDKLLDIGEFSDSFYQAIKNQSNNQNGCFIWPTQPCEPVGLTLQGSGLSNGMTIIKRDKKSIKTWAFIGAKDDYETTNLFFNNREIFFHFIQYFQSEANKKIAMDSRPYAKFKSPTLLCQQNNQQSIHSHKLKENMPIKRFYLSDHLADVYLSARERQCIQLIAKCYSYKEVGEKLDIKQSTVRRHVDSIKLKTGIMKRSELINTLSQMRIIE